MPPILIGVIILFGVLLIVLLGAGIGSAAIYHAVIGAKSGGGGVPVPTAPPPTTRKPWDWWDILYSKGCPPKMQLEGDGSYTFPFPKAPGSVHYITTTAPAASIGQLVHMEFTTEGSGTIMPTPESGAGPARVRLYLEQKYCVMYMPEHDPNAVVAHEMERWWSSENVIITDVPGSFTLQIPLNPALWTSVYGRAGDNPLCGDGFANCLANLAQIGFTFGASFAGHGNVLVGDTAVATFRLKSFKIILT